MTSRCLQPAPVAGQKSLWPRPVPDLRPVYAVRVRVLHTVGNLITEPLLRVGTYVAKARYALDNVQSQVVTADVVQDRQLERGVDITLFLVPAHVDVFVILPAVREPVNEQRITVKVEYDRLVAGEE